MKIVLTGGGTGGHVYPALKIGEYLEKEYNAELFYIGNKGSIEEKLAKENGIPFFTISSKGLEGSNPISKYANFLIKNSTGTIQTINILEKIKPDFIVGTGGFVSAPVLAAAVYKKIPYAIHEQNSVMGKVNKLFESKAEKVFLTFPLKENKHHHLITGIPVRFNKKIEKNGETITFMGGSGGSERLNNFAIEYAKNNPGFKVRVITGNRNYEEYIKKDLPKNLEALSYVDDMATLYKESKIIIARSGAGSVFEIANSNIPAIFVPYPLSAENHQYTNAKYLVDKKAALLVEEGEAFEENLNENINLLIKDPTIIKKLKENMESMTVESAEEMVGKQIKNIIESKIKC